MVTINSKDTERNNVNVTFEKNGKSFTQNINTITSHSEIQDGVDYLIRENVINDDNKLNAFLQDYVEAFNPNEVAPVPVEE